MPGSFLDTDLQNTFSLDGENEFGSAVEYRAAFSGEVVNFFAIFDHAYQAVELEGNVRVASEIPMLTCRTLDLPSGAAQGDVVVVDAVQYAVTGLQPDGTGVTVIALHKLNP